jgi:hypothetical protein
VATSIIGRMAAILSLDVKGFTTGLTDASKRLDKFASTTKNAGRTLVGITAPLTIIGALAVREASKVAELQGRFDAAFGDSADSVRAWSDTFARAINGSREELRQFASQVGDAFRAFGLGTEETARLSTAVVELSEDFADFKGRQTTEVVDAFTAAIQGQTRGLKALGVTTEDIDEKLRALGFADGAKDAQEFQKAMAGLLVVLDETKPAFGSATAGAGDLDGILKGLKGVATDASVVIGVVLGEAIQSVGPRLITFGRDLVTADKATVRWVVGLGAAAVAAGPLLIGLAALAKSIAVLLGGLKLLVIGLTSFPLWIGLATAAFAFMMVAVADSDGSIRDWARGLPIIGKSIDEWATKAFLTVEEAATRLQNWWRGVAASDEAGIGSFLRGGAEGPDQRALAASQAQLRALAERRRVEENRLAELTSMSLDPGAGGAGPDAGFGPKIIEDAVKRYEEIRKAILARIDTTALTESSIAAATKQATKEWADAQKAAIDSVMDEMDKFLDGLTDLVDLYDELDERFARATLGDFEVDLANVREEATAAAKAMNLLGEATKFYVDEAERKFRAASTAEGVKSLRDQVTGLQRDFRDVNLKPVEQQLVSFDRSIMDMMKEKRITELTAEIVEFRRQGREAIVGTAREAEMSSINIGRSIAGILRGTLSGVVDGTLTAKDVLQRFSTAALDAVEGFFLGALEKKLDFDQKWETNWLGDLPEIVIKGVGSMIQGFGKFIDYAIDGVVKLIAWLIEAVSWQTILTGLKVVGGGVLGLIGLSEGAIVTRPTAAVIAEGGQPEAVIPLSRLREFGGGGKMTVNIHPPSGTTTETKKSRGPSGELGLDVYIKNVVAGDVVQGGVIAQAMDSSRGTRQMGLR